MHNLTAKPSLDDARRLAAAAHRLMTARATPTDLRDLNAYRNGNDRDMANAARFFLEMHSGCEASAYDTLPSDSEPSRDNVVSIRTGGSPDAWL